jgi:flagellin
MAELRTMAQDITKNTGDIENYSKEFMELQGQLNQIQKEKFNGISLFSTGTGTSSGILNRSDDGGTYIDGDGNSLNYDTFSRTLQTHDSGSSSDGSVSINVINFQFMLSIGGTASSPTGNSFNLGNIGDTKGTSDEFTGDYINDIKEVSVGAFIDVIARIADMRAENGAEQNRVMQRIDLLQSNLTNIEAAHGRIMDADIALESTRFARHNILVQASASMTAQANQLSSVALSLIG